MWNRREGSPFRARAVIKALNQRGIPLTDNIAQALDDLDRIEAELPAEPEPTALHDAIIDGADAQVLDDLVLRELGSSRIRAAYAQAKLTAAVSVLRALIEDRDELHAYLADRAQQCIDTLTRCAAISEPIDSLIRSGRTDEAKALADKELAGRELSELYQLRDIHLTPDSVEVRPAGVDCSQWVDPRKVTNLHGDSPADTYINGLRRGGVLHYPTPEEAAALAAPIAAEMLEAAERRRQDQHGVGYMAV